MGPGHRERPGKEPAGGEALRREAEWCVEGRGQGLSSWEAG